MTGKEWLRVLLVASACNGWWAFARWPTLGAGDQVFGPTILLGLAPTIGLLLWAVFGILNRWED